MQAEAGPAQAWWWILAAACATALGFAVTASAQQLPTPTRVVIDVPLPSPDLSAGASPTTSTTSSFMTTGDGGSSSPSAGLTTQKCRGCVPPGALLPSQDASSAQDQAAPEGTGAAHAEDGAPGAPPERPFQANITLPGFGLLIGLAALVVILRHRRR